MQNLYVLHQRHNKQGEKAFLWALKRCKTLANFSIIGFFTNKKMQIKMGVFSAKIGTIKTTHLTLHKAHLCFFLPYP